MKVLLFATEFNSAHLLMVEIKKSAHLVIETVDDPNRLIHEIARTTPHLLVAHSPENVACLDTVRALFPDLSVCLLKGDLAEQTHWQQTLQDALSRPILPPMPRPYADDNRFVLHDESLQKFWKGKLGRPEQKEGWQTVCSDQEARFVLQLQTGRQNHAAAKRYFECLLAQQAGLDQEIGYRVAHGSYKSLSWSRDLAVKWLALMAHYVSDAELEYLPVPGTSGPAIDYVHHDLSIEGMYATTLIILSSIKPSMASAIKELATARFDEQDEHTLLVLSLKLYGMAKFLESVSRSQIKLMDAWLDPSIIHRLDQENVPRGEHRAAGIYRDFYDLTFIVHSPEPLASILKGFHAGTTYVEERRYLPSFAEFRRLCRQSHNQ